MVLYCSNLAPNSTACARTSLVALWLFRYTAAAERHPVSPLLDAHHTFVSRHKQQQLTILDQGFRQRPYTLRLTRPGATLFAHVAAHRAHVALTLNSVDAAQAGVFDGSQNRHSCFPTQRAAQPATKSHCLSAVNMRLRTAARQRTLRASSRLVAARERRASAKTQEDSLLQ